MAGVSLGEMHDLLKGTTERLPLDFEVPLQYQEYPFCNMFLAKDKRVIRGGTRIVENVAIDRSGNAKHVSAYEPEAVNVTQNMGQMKAEFVRARTHWSIERGEEALNRSGRDAHSFAEQLYNLGQQRELVAKLDLANLLEEAPWKVPLVDADNKIPLGIPYWVPKLAAGQAPTAAGFYGGRYDTALFTSVAGIQPATAGDNTTAITGGKELWRSWQAGYGADINDCLLYTSPSPRDQRGSRMPSSA